MRSDRELGFRYAYDGLRMPYTRIEPGEGPGAVQSFKDECDINRIMAKYQKSGAVQWLEKRGGEYRDVTGIDFMEAMQTVVKGKEVFADLPSSIRDRFNNDPALFLDFMHDPDNHDEMIKLGLARAKVVAPPAPPVRVQVVVPEGTTEKPPG